MNKKDVDVCISAECCCKLIMKCPEKPAPGAAVKPRNPFGERAKNPDMSLCDFLKSQPFADWIKSLQDNRSGAKNPKDRPRGPVRPVVAPAPVSRICEQPPPADRGAKQPQNHHQDIKQNPVQPAVQEDRNMSQIIINIGTIITNGVCKRDSCQQTDSEVQISVSPPAKCPTSACPPVERPTSICPPEEKPTTACPPAEKSATVCPPAEKPTTACPPAEKPTTTRPPAEKPTTACPPIERPTSICPPAEKRTSVCSPAERPTAVILPKVRSPAAGSIPVSRDRSCRYQGNTPSAMPSTDPKSCPEPKIKFKVNCCCTCHLD
ncbi:repetitive proline-rich cell wall protein 2 [Acyrthosiphon pisum]|uniref:Uncharacterized protein n=1 Tax=Acyrthosiphon pisum TaxID=7029 RepID=A0A8R1W4M3_ACYPI|nr:repetitive proline-rich cell wall protein 2 [Acyrthosiphon pisum]|eukprot:XP_003242303.1 PREDICTED: repetitive proline-rich cell wall protein 2-like [Acyrthosiphon pisum]